LRTDGCETPAESNAPDDPFERRALLFFDQVELSGCFVAPSCEAEAKPIERVPLESIPVK